ncbi:MAG: hypothetical protein CVU84_00865 [Firmicutes bacterium HGW-Firmicutes-1]|jgi:ribose transport system substrate-binding protein|nr:MAG: hypothetical protein CVU84_00865 [Firmicutes bacterium HGW-Firmicutes-1]
MKKSNLFQKMIAFTLLVVFFSLTFTGCKNDKETAVTSSDSKAGDSTAVKEKRVYYFVAGFQGHPYLIDAHKGFEYAAEMFDVEIVRMGPDGFDSKATSEAMEQAIAKKPDGIITMLWDSAQVPAIQRAMADGIPVIATTSNVPDSGVMTYIGLDNYQCGIDTAKELINQAGDTGKLVALGNWGASNTDDKFRGLMDGLKGTKWELLSKVDDKANTETAIEAAKSAFNNYEDLTAIVGLDSSSGTGIGIAMEELKIDPKNVAVVVHDREVGTIEYIQKGLIRSTIINKTATDSYMAILLLEAYNDQTIGLSNVPVSRDNKAAGINIVPETIYEHTVVINQQNVEEFLYENLPEFPKGKELYN